MDNILHNKERSILHCDMNSFFASVELIKRPDLIGKPMAVAGSSKTRNGIILSKTIEAKNKGIKTADVIWQAKQKCPELILLPPNYDEYMKYSILARKIYNSYTDRVEAFGIDECWLDISGTENLFGSNIELAEKLRQRIKKELNLTISIGVSFNKIFAKLGSDYKKTDAITVINRENFKTLAWPLKVNALMGVGKATYKKLMRYNINTIRDLAITDNDFLKDLLGINGLYLKKAALGLDNTPVAYSMQNQIIKSIGRGKTSPKDLKNIDEVKRFIEPLAYEVSKTLRENNLLAGGIQISTKNNKFKNKQYQMPLPYSSQNSELIKKNAVELFKKNYSWQNDLRAISVRAINLQDENSIRQISIYEVNEKMQKSENIDKCVYEIHKKFGNKSLIKAWNL